MKTVDLIIFSGQSNMQGQTEQLITDGPVPGATEYCFLSDSMIPLEDPVGEDITRTRGQGMPFRKDTNQVDWVYSHLTGSCVYGHTSLVPAFCRAYREQTGNDVVAVHAAKGSTLIAEWMPGTIAYGLLVDKALAAIKKVRETSTLGRIFFVWLQGESDAIVHSSAAYYREALLVLQNALKEALGLHCFGIIRVGRFANNSWDDAIMAAQEEVCEMSTDFQMLTRLTTELNQQPEFMNPYARGHYNAAGLIRLGQDAGTALGKIRNRL